MIELLQEITSKCLYCAKPKCVAACPIGNNIPHILQLVKNKQFFAAARELVHPFGSVCSLVCPQHANCQSSCVLALKDGAGVDFPVVERYLDTYWKFTIRREDLPDQNQTVTQNGQTTVINPIKKIAVVGGGPAGITIATKMHLAGHKVVLFERNSLLSTLRLIPDYRLPPSYISEVIKRTEFCFEYVNRNVTPQLLVDLTKRYDMVYLCVGKNKMYNLGIPGEELATPYDQALTELLDGEVIVVGGGNTAVDCATLTKARAQKVTIAYRRSVQEMPCFPRELYYCQRAGVEILNNLAPVKLEKVDDKLHLTLAKTVSENRGKLTVTDEQITLVADHVVSAVGSYFDKTILSAFGDTLPANLVLLGDCNGGSLVREAISQALGSDHTQLGAPRNFRCD